MLQNIKYRLCGDKDETINNIISECSKLAQKEYKTERRKYPLKLCKKLKFDHICNMVNFSFWYMHKLDSVLENEIHKIL